MTPSGEARVVSHNYYTKLVHVLQKTGDNCWVEKKYHQLDIQEHEGFLWGMEKPFLKNKTSYVQLYRY